MRTFTIILLYFFYSIFSFIEVVLAIPAALVKGFISDPMIHAIRLLKIGKKGKLTYLRKIKRYRAMVRLEKKKSKKFDSNLNKLVNTFQFYIANEDK